MAYEQWCGRAKGRIKQRIIVSWNDIHYCQCKSDFLLWFKSGISGDGVDKCVLSVIMADMEEAGDDDVFRKLRGDLDEASVEISDQAIRDKMAECLKIARDHFYS